MSDGVKRWRVDGYRRITVMMLVEAETQEEAIEKAKAGDYLDVDTEPGTDLHKPKWTATEGGWRS